MTTAELVAPKVSPATLRLVARDDEADFLRLSLCYQLPGEASLPLTRLSGVGVDGNEVELTTSSQGIETLLSWDFEEEPHPAGGTLGTGFRAGLRLIVSGGSEIVERVLDLGNDPPEITDLEAPSEELSGFVPVAFRVRDSSGDVVSIEAEWRRMSETDADWRTATPFDNLDSIQANAEGVELTFLWNTDADLPDDEDAVLLRFTPDDLTLDGGAPVGIGLSVVTGPLRVDNNEEPILTLFGDAVLASADRRRGIPVPFRLTDAEGDPVEVVFQWSRPGEGFPALPSARAELEAILADPALRQEYRVCSPYPRYARGRAFPVDELAIRLPELAQTESWLVSSGIEGATLELLRPSSIPEPISARWEQNPLSNPVVALPLGEGLTVLVLESFGDSWRLRELDLTTGAVLPEATSVIAAGAGAPTAMTLEVEPLRRIPVAALVASEGSGAWSIQRVELGTGEVTELFASDASSEPPPVRGIASIGTGTALFTAGSSLQRLDYRPSETVRAAPILSDLAGPHGVAVDPLHPNKVYVAERDALTSSGTGRILSIALDTHARLPLAVSPRTPAEDLERPEQLAVERNGSRLIVVGETPGGASRRLFGIHVGLEGNNLFTIGQPLASPVSSVAAGPDGLRVLAVPSRDELRVAGGVEQRGEIAGYQSQTGLTLLRTPLRPEVRPNQPWRARAGSRVRGSAGGALGTFVWDSSPARGGPAVLRATPWDDERGTAGETLAPLLVRGDLEVPPLVLGGPGVTDGTAAVATGDLDADGDVDLVATDFFANNLKVFFQAAGSFDSEPLSLGSTQTTDGPTSVAAADVDVDGDVDLVSANPVGDTITVFFQDAGGGFDPPVVLGEGAWNQATSVQAADLDSDGDLDLVSASNSGDNLRVFEQTAPGVFDPAPLVVALPEFSLPLFVNTADLDSDADLDVVCTTLCDTVVFFQTAPLAFGPGLFFRGDETGHPFSVEGADLDLDGDMDLHWADISGRDLTIFFQTAPGTFGPTALELSGPEPGIRANHSVAADVDGDGDLDLLSANGSEDDPRPDDSLTIFYQTTPGAFDPVPSVVEEPLGEFPRQLAVSDLDGDGRLDFVAANRFGDRLKVFLQDGPGRFGAPPTIVDGFPVFEHSESTEIVPADLDGDDDLDIVIAGVHVDATGSGGQPVFYQTLPGKFELGRLELSAVLSFLTAADLDGDGDLDLAGSYFNAGTSYLLAYFQSFAGFELQVVSTALNGALHVAAADLDADGDCDLVVVNAADHLAVFFQLEPGVFDPEPLVLAAPGMIDGPNRVLPVDLDGDGLIDLVSPNGISDNLAILFQDKPGSFGPSPLILGLPGMDGVVSVDAADLDGDGDLDLVSANLLSRNLTVFFQTAAGVFDPAGTLLPVPSGGPPGVVSATDLDGDGDADLVCSDTDFRTGGSLSVLYQTLPGVFGPEATLLLGSPQSSPHHFVPVDLDGDGDIDLPSLGRAHDNIALYWGGR